MKTITEKPKDNNCGGNVYCDAPISPELLIILLAIAGFTVFCTLVFFFPKSYKDNMRGRY